MTQIAGPPAAQPPFGAAIFKASGFEVPGGKAVDAGRFQIRQEDNGFMLLHNIEDADTIRIYSFCIGAVSLTG